MSFSSTKSSERLLIARGFFSKPSPALQLPQPSLRALFHQGQHCRGARLGCDGAVRLVVASWVAGSFADVAGLDRAVVNVPASSVHTLGHRSLMMLIFDSDATAGKHIIDRDRGVAFLGAGSELHAETLAARVAEHTHRTRIIEHHTQSARQL